MAGEDLAMVKRRKRSNINLFVFIMKTTAAVDILQRKVENPKVSFDPRIKQIKRAVSPSPSDTLRAWFSKNISDDADDEERGN